MPNPTNKPQAQKPQAATLKAPMERLLVIFDYANTGHILFCQGARIEPEAREHAEIAYHTIEAPEGATPGSLWVYEVHPFQDASGTWWHREGVWRVANAAKQENAAVSCNAYLGLWKDIPYGEEYLKEVMAATEQAEPEEA